jgi:cob(I)alamin adenosyltransferase
MKKNVEYGEIMFLQGKPGLDIFQFGTEHLVDPNNPAQIDIDEAEKAFQKAKETLKSNLYDLVVLDEINVAVAWNLITLDSQLSLFEIPTESEIVMTGRYAEKAVIDKADLVTEMKEVKHYYNIGVNAREGVEL